MTQRRDTNIPETCPRTRLLFFSGLRSITRGHLQGCLQLGYNCEGGWYLGMRGRLNKVEAETIHHPCAMCLATCDNAKPPIRLDHTIITPYFDRPPTPSTTYMLPHRPFRLLFCLLFLCLLLRSLLFHHFSPCHALAQQLIVTQLVDLDKDVLEGPLCTIPTPGLSRPHSRQSKAHSF